MSAWLQQVEAGNRLEDDLNELCSLHGRLAGTPGEAAAVNYLEARLAEYGDAAPQPFTFSSWAPVDPWVEVVGKKVETLPATTLLMSPATGTEGQELPVVDVGRGSPEEFALAGARLEGAAALVRHEYPFVAGHVHRGRKYQLAKRYGARAFVIANNIPACGVVGGFSATDEPADIPAVGTSFEAGERLAGIAREGGRVHLTVDTQRATWDPRNLILEIPGRTDEWVVLCAHLDGHALSESAMDNASGVVTALEALRTTADQIPRLRRGLRVIFFTFEEWGYHGSKHYVANLSEDEKSSISLVVNLDTVVGHPTLCAAVSGLEEVESFVNGSSLLPISIVRPVLANSDHYSFLAEGIPALRLIAGYGYENSATRYLLTAADTRDKVEPGQLWAASRVTSALVLAACSSSERPSRRRSRDEVEHLHRIGAPGWWDAEDWARGDVARL